MLDELRVRNERLRADCSALIEDARRIHQQSVTLMHQSAQARCKTVGQTLRIDYSGAITIDAIRSLDRQCLPERMGAVWTLENSTKAMTAYGSSQDLDSDLWTVQTPPSAVIVRPDQMDEAIVFVKLLARLGVRRTCWVEEHRPIAQAWLAQFA